jgi:pSer/pThr/pTyr-binding forkhead associated (FHA) protein
MPPKLLLKFNAAVVKDIPVVKTTYTIGRKPDNDIVIDNMAVSGHHAKITLQDGNYVVEDLQSTNGTFLNDKKILNSALKNNDTITIGQHSLVFMAPPAEPKAEPPKSVIPETMNSDATMIITPKDNQPSHEAAGKSELIGVLRAIEGKSDQPEYQLTALLTYIGKGETAAIKIKGFFAPDIAALISRRQAGYLLTAVKDGYPKHNNKSVSGQLELKDEDIIEVGGIKFLFQLKEAKPQEEIK